MSETPETSETAGPLSGVTVLDLGQAYQGPYVGFLLAKAGASVIKIEPITGENSRMRESANKGALFPFAMLNSSKKAVTLNLKIAQGREMLIEMVKKADVLVENFAPFVMDRLGVGWEVLHAANPRLVYGSGTGFGLTGTDVNRLAMDLIIQAYSGVMSITGQPGSPPLKAGPAVADFLGGAHLYGGVVSALYERNRTGVGRRVEVAMQEAVYPTLISALGLAQGERREQAKTGNRHSGMSLAPWSVYEASDGHVAIVCVTDAHWKQLLIAMQREDLNDDERYSTNGQRVARMDEVDDLIDQWTSRRTRAEIAALTAPQRVPCAPVRGLSEVMNDASMLERGMLERIDHPELGSMTVFGSPLRFHGVIPRPTTPSPRLGQHNQEVFGAWLGLDARELDRLAAEGVI